MASSYLGDLFSVLFDAMRSSMLVVRIGIRIGIRLRLRIRIRLRIHPVYVECSAVQCSAVVAVMMRCSLGRGSVFLECLLWLFLMWCLCGVDIGTGVTPGHPQKLERYRED